MNVIGIGAQKAGTSWIYACLYEHPELCFPFKELHFFSRDRYETKGLSWYKEQFSSCDSARIAGEFSTSYLFSEVAAKRIKESFPDAKIICSLRNPVTRAFSQYRNAVKAGEITKGTSFRDAVVLRPDILEQGLYAEQVKRYLDHFPSERLLFLRYEDSLRDPASFISRIYRFIGVDDGFTPTFLHRSVNTKRTPRVVGIDRMMVSVASLFRRLGLQKLVWVAKKSGVTDAVRSVNTVASSDETLSFEDKAYLEKYYREDVEKLGQLLGDEVTRGWLS